MMFLQWERRDGLKSLIIKYNYSIVIRITSMTKRVTLFQKK